MHPHTYTHTRSSVLVSWLPYCTLAVFNKWSCVYLCVCGYVDSSVSPPGLMSHPAFPPPRWHYSALLITHHHLHFSRDLWHETQHTHTHTHTHTKALHEFLFSCEACANYDHSVCASSLIHSNTVLMGVASSRLPSSAAPSPHKGAWQAGRERDGLPIPPPGSDWLGWRVPAPDPLS